MSKLKPPKNMGAYSLIELIVTLLLLGIVAIYVQSKFSSSDPFKQETFIAQIVSSARLAQQLSMNDSARTFTLKIQTNQIDLTENGSGSHASIESLNFPLLMDTGMTLSPTTDIIFDSLGETTPVTIELSSDTTQSICFEANGYIHRC